MISSRMVAIVWRKTPAGARCSCLLIARYLCPLDDDFQRKIELLSRA